jgi:hypothetical protein
MALLLVAEQDRRDARYTGMSRRHPRPDGSALKAAISFDGKAAAELRTSATASPRA